jgi:hypothetical protein
MNTSNLEAGALLRGIWAAIMPKRDIRPDLLISIGNILRLQGVEQAELPHHLRIGRYTDPDGSVLYFADVARTTVFCVSLLGGDLEYLEYEPGTWQEQLNKYEVLLRGRITAHEATD